MTNDFKPEEVITHAYHPMGTISRPGYNPGSI